VGFLCLSGFRNKITTGERTRVPLVTFIAADPLQY
jgi:hypothetical protein